MFQNTILINQNWLSYQMNQKAEHEVDLVEPKTLVLMNTGWIRKGLKPEWTDLQNSEDISFVDKSFLSNRECQGHFQKK
jgi:hypothetical protein